MFSIAFEGRRVTVVNRRHFRNPKSEKMIGTKLHSCRRHHLSLVFLSRHPPLRRVEGVHMLHLNPDPSLPSSCRHGVREGIGHEMAYETTESNLKNLQSRFVTPSVRSLALLTILLSIPLLNPLDQTLAQTLAPWLLLLPTPPRTSLPMLSPFTGSPKSPLLSEHHLISATHHDQQGITTFFARTGDGP